ncbi:protein kinase [Planctomycetota bacterium]
MKRSEKINQIVGDCTGRLIRGEEIDVAAIVQAHPDLMPELGKLLRKICDAMPAVPETDSGPADTPGTQAAGSQCLSPQDLEGLLDGIVEPEDRARIESHLENCAVCREEWADRREFEELLQSFESRTPPALPLPTITIDDYEFDRCIGRGASGEVWLARQTRIKQERAIKIVNLEQCSPRDRERLAREMQIMGELGKHRNRVVLHESHVIEDNLVLIMEYVPGSTLSQMTSLQSPMPWDKACKYVGDVADGLLEVHAKDVLHRDIKPANILLDSGHDEALLGDFGLATYATDAEDKVGTAGYTPPELLYTDATPKSDVFSLSATLFHLVAGQPAFEATDLSMSLRMAAAGLIRPVPALRNVPQAVEDLILAGLEPEPEKRIDLCTFIERLRGAHLQSLADQLRKLSARSGVGIRVSVSTANERDLVFQPVDCQLQCLESHRGMNHVPEPSPLASVQTGDLVRLETLVDADGYLTVLNLGSSGELAVVFPNPNAPDNRIRAGEPSRVTAKMTPPAGTDRAAIIWTRQPDQLTPEGWRKRIEAAEVAEEPPSEATRGMDFVLHEADEQPGDAWAAAVVTVVHHPPQRSGERGSSAPTRSELRSADNNVDRDTSPPETRGVDLPSADTAASPALPAELASTPPRDPLEPTHDPVDCTVFSPPNVPRGGTVMVQVFAHMPELAAEARRLAQESDDEAKRRGSKGLEIDIPRGERLLFHLAVPGLEVDDPAQILIWQGRTEPVQFGVTAPEDCPQGTVIGTVHVNLGKHQIPVGHVKFKLAVTAAESQDVAFQARPADESACRYRKAFISYASADRNEVMKRVHMLELLKIDYFHDVLKLEPGQRWEQALYRHIDDCDLFLLFWSSAAKKSTWVLEEARYALQCKGGDDTNPPEMVPVILEGPPPVEPPEDLKHLHFNDRFVYFVV